MSLQTLADMRQSFQWLKYIAMQARYCSRKSMFGQSKFLSEIFFEIMKKRTQSLRLYMIFIWQRMNSSFSRLSIEPQVYTWTSWSIFAASPISFSPYFYLTSIITQRAYQTQRKIFFQQTSLIFYITQVLSRPECSFIMLMHPCTSSICDFLYCPLRLHSTSAVAKSSLNFFASRQRVTMAFEILRDQLQSLVSRASFSLASSFYRLRSNADFSIYIQKYLN